MGGEKLPDFMLWHCFRGCPTFLGFGVTPDTLLAGLDVSSSEWHFVFEVNKRL